LAIKTGQGRRKIMQDDTSPIRFNPGKSGYYKDDSKTRPTGSAGGKDFGKLMSKNEEEGKSSSGRKQIKGEGDSDEEGDEIALLDDEMPPQGPVSLFDMSKAQASKLRKPVIPDSKIVQAQPEASNAHSILGEGEKTTQTGPKVDVGEDIPLEPEHIGDAVKQSKVIELAKEPARPFDLIASASRDMPSSVDRPLNKSKNKETSPFNREQPDLSTVNPLATQSNATINTHFSTQTEKPVLPVKSLQEIINQMVKEVQSMEAEGKTDTTVTLKYPPVFEGAQLVVTSFDNARGEFNIAFENLTQAAQKLLEAQENKANLLLALEQKGYHVHIITASTIDEQRLQTSNVEDPHRDRNEEGNDQQQQHRGRDEEEA
jgi:hypothetical protein